MLKSILLDFDGTLVNSLPMFLVVYDKTLRNFGIKLNKQDIIENCFGKTADQICNKLKIPQSSQELSKVFISNIKESHNSIKLFPGAKDLLEYSKSKRIKLGIVSFAYRWYLDYMLDELAIKNYFDSIIGFDDVKKPKPDPEAVILSYKKFKVNPEEVLVMGDTRNDIIMGKAAGCKAALFFPKENESFYDINLLKSSNPDFTITEFSKLKELI